MSRRAGPNSEDVERIVDAMLRKHARRFPGLRPRVLPGGVARRDAYWWVPVATAKDPARRFDYYDKLSDLEDELRRPETNLNVLIVPSGTMAVETTKR